MAHESANPRIRVMFAIAISSALSLAVLDQVFKSYFNMMMEEEEHDKVLGVPPLQYNELRAQEQQRLTSASVPISKAMKELAIRGREDPSLKDLANTDISPQPSNDQAALVGWAGLGREAGAPAAPAPTDHTLPADHTPPAGADAGAHPDGAAPPKPRGGNLR